MVGRAPMNVTILTAWLSLTISISCMRFVVVVVVVVVSWGIRTAYANSSFSLFLSALIKRFAMFSSSSFLVLIFNQNVVLCS